MKSGNNFTLICPNSNNFLRNNYDLDKMQVKLFPDFTSILFDNLLISGVTNYTHNRGFLTCLLYLSRTPYTEKFRA